MRNGRRWLALDADFLLNPFTERLLARFGPTGVVAFIGFLCACKRSGTPGTISFATDAEGRALLGIIDLPLVDGAGDKWTLDEFWRFTGQQKQTRMTRVGQRKKVMATHWTRWQKNLTRQEEAERKAISRAQKRADTFWTASGTASGQQPDTTWDRQGQGHRDPPTPQRGAGMAPPKSTSKTEVNDNGTLVRPGTAAALKATMRGDEP